ncbi:MAG TPA: sulfur carrier protein ThiS [Bacteroidales bacterium]|jgi:thiamine biosynthesis protein ThiS|nr:sulfur carrier protein ThiS [Bacteroidales bacterium]HXK82584.1 sulfur carrier protein ThiS [Bacteroidales bacterium]
MKIILNNRTEVFDKNNMSISEIMEIKNFSYQKIIVKLNNIIIEKEDFKNTIVKEGDNLVILHLLAGG